MNTYRRKAVISAFALVIYIAIIVSSQIAVHASHEAPLIYAQYSTTLDFAAMQLRASQSIDAPQKIHPINREKARDYLLSAVERYSGKLRPEEILIGSPNEGPEHLLRPATRVEAIIMISRAFGRLPAPVGDLDRSGAQAPQFIDVPDWAEKEVDNLSHAKILLPTDDNMLNGDEIIDESEFYLMIKRIYALLSYAPQDDFYRTINRDWLENMDLRAGKSSSSIFGDMEHEVERKVNKELKNVLAGAWHKGTIEQKISDFYNTIINMDSRDSIGLEPLKPYLEAIKSANSLYALDKALYAISRDLGVDLFFSFSLEPNINNNAKYSVYLTYPTSTLPKNLAQDINSPQMEAFANYAASLFELADYFDPYTNAESVKRLEWLLARGQRDPAQPINYAEEYKLYSISKLKKLFPAADIVTLGALSGLKPEENYYITDTKLLSAFSYIYDEDNLDAVKAYAAFKLLDTFSDVLSQPMLDARYVFINAVEGTPQIPELEHEARAKVVSLASAYFEEIYIEKHFSQAVKRDVEAMSRILTEILKIRASELDWMSEETKNTAIKKLDTVNIKVGMPQKWDNIMDSVSIRSAAEGGTYFENLTAYYRQSRALIAKKQGKAVDKDAWDMSVLTVNASYNALANEIIIPAAILQAPLYIYRGKKEINYGGIGTIIAHELIHVIDIYGEQFDEFGNMEHWWTDDEKAFFINDICDLVAQHYDGYEAAPGLIVDGYMTVMENIADLGMIACALEAVDSLPNPDYKLFFTKAAGLWANTSTRKSLDIALRSDSHSPGNARVNKTFQNFEQFYNAYNIKQSDGMYIAPEKRLNIW